MIRFEEMKQKLLAMKPKIEELSEALSLEDAKKEIAALEEKTAAPDFWSSQDGENQKILQRLSELKAKVEAYKSLYNNWEDTLTLTEMALEEQDESVWDDVETSYGEVSETLDRMTLETLLSGQYDKNNAILTFHAGAGGTEAQDWAEMLYRMYTRYAERHHFKVKLIDFLDGDEAGLKSATVLIEGTNAYGYLKSEAGVHRLVRISPFDASGRRHTSFASLEVMPEINEDMNITINPDDLKVDTFRSSGAGGQHVNKTESAIRITHIPTGIVVACQTERSQHQNRDTAMKMLISKLVEIKEREHLERIEDIKGEQKEIAWGSQIRSYVFMPYTLAKDHRTGYESGNINAVMDGDIDGFINEYLKQLSQGKL
ncbi:MAG: peptide chain release factor 2 [Clostridia bacterium]|nr:peptide chain release factor 2 [Clostridia bacterium]